MGSSVVILEKPEQDSMQDKGTGAANGGIGRNNSVYCGWAPGAVDWK
jgi:hypothetical protein